MNLCPFCSFHQSRIVAGSEIAIALKDAFPVTEGHTLVVPRRHVMNIYELSAEDQAEMWALVGKVREVLLLQIAVDGDNIGVNDGWAAGQTVEHAHIHIIPRRKGDVPDPRGGIRNIISNKARYWDPPSSFGKMVRLRWWSYREQRYRAPRGCRHGGCLWRTRSGRCAATASSISA